MENQVIYQYCVRHNGIDIGSDDHDQRYFDRRRKARLEKKLSLGPYLKVIACYHMEIDAQTIRGRFGGDALHHGWFVIEDAIIDLSYVDVKKAIFHPDRYLGFSSSGLGKEGGYRAFSAWEIRAPDLATYQSIIEVLERDLKAIIPHRGWFDEVPGYIGG